MGYQLIPPPNGRRARVPQQGCHEVRRASAADLSKSVEFEDGSTLGRFQRTVEIDSIHDANEPGTEQHASRERTKDREAHYRKWLGVQGEDCSGCSPHQDRVNLRIEWAALSADLATSAAPRVTTQSAGCLAPKSTRRTTSESSRPTGASKSPPRAALKNASTTPR